MPRNKKGKNCSLPTLAFPPSPGKKENGGWGGGGRGGGRNRRGGASPEPSALIGFQASCLLATTSSPLLSLPYCSTGCLRLKAGHLLPGPHDTLVGGEWREEGRRAIPVLRVPKQRWGPAGEKRGVLQSETKVRDSRPLRQPMYGGVWHPLALPGKSGQGGGT